MTETRRIRPIPRDALPAIGRVLDATGLFPSDMLDEMIAGYLAGGSAEIWFACMVGDEPVAFGYCVPERMTEGTFNLLAIAVAPDRQRSGVGTAMLKHLEDRLAKGGGRILIVETSGLADYADTRAFYAASGYSEEARIRDFYAAGEDKIVFRKALC